MTRFIATIEIPVNIWVEADDIEDAEVEADSIFAQVYEELEGRLQDMQDSGDITTDVSFGARYDDTEIEEVRS